MQNGLDRLVEVAVSLVQGRRRVLLGLAGAPGVGKSTLAADLVSEVAARRGADWVARVPMDGFHLADVQLDRLGSRGRKGAPDTFDVDGYAHLLRRLLAEADRPVYAPGFERTLEQPVAAAVVVPPSARLVVTEGNYLLLPRPPWEAVRRELTEVWHLAADEQLRRERLVDRHVAFGKDREAAARWVLEIDGPNAALVVAAAGGADRVVLNGAGGWQLMSPTP